MKKTAKCKVIVFVVLLTVALCACEKNSDSITANSPVSGENETEENKTEENKVDKEEKEDNVDNNDGVDSNRTDFESGQKDVSSEKADGEAAKGKTAIYYSNNDATGFSVEEVEVENLSAESLLKKLAEKGVVSDEIKVLSCEETYDDTKKVIILDLSPEFTTYLQNFGLAGERITIQSVCNTFIKAYGCASVKITVEGDVLVTGHAEYPGYITFSDKL